jgi:ABC-2 type transport system permease protein
MTKVLSIARTEYLQAVRSKAFLIGVLLMPVMMGGSLLFRMLVSDRVDLTERRCAVVDPTDGLWPALQVAVQVRNREAIWELESDGARTQTRPAFALELYEPAEDERPEVTLSERVRDGELQGFMVLDGSLLDDEIADRALAYYTDEPTYTELPNWLLQTVNGELRRRRIEEAEVDPELVARLERRVGLTTLGLARAREDGSIQEAEVQSKAVTIGIPLAALMLMFVLVMTTAPQLMNQVLEEKMQRISEVLVSSVTPFQLMLGKLLGSVAISLTLSGLYLGAVWWATHHWGVDHYVPASAYAWFLGLMVCALLMYGSLFSALGAACSELRDAQSLVMPAMLILMLPMFALSAIIESPNGTLAVGMTYFPSATPMILLFRVLAPPGPPAWELVAAPLMCLAATAALVWASGKIFRIGVLAQGQTPSFRRLLGWVLSK